MRFPKEGDIYEVREDVQVRYLTHWQMPYTGCGNALLRKGRRVRIGEVFSDQPVAIGASPLDAVLTELELIPAAGREHPRYAGYSLSLHIVELERTFQLVKSRGDSP